MVDVVCCVWAFHSDTLLPDDLVSSGIIDAACRHEVDESEFESFDRLFSQLPVMKGELLEFIQCLQTLCCKYVTCNCKT